MRITRDTLLTLARDVSSLRFRQDHDVMCIYLTGSMRLPLPLLGGATDIDLVFVHAKDPTVPREIEKISEDISLDISHLPQSAFLQPRRLRSDPWLGGFLCESPIVLQEHQHWFEFTQAAVYARFYAPETVLERVKPLLEQGRRQWFSLQSVGGTPRAQEVKAFLDAVETSINAIACLYGPPLTERRLLLDFAALSEKVEQPSFSILANHLIAIQDLPADTWQMWTPRWKEDLRKVSSRADCPASLLPARHNYYVKACEALQVDAPAAALWIMLRTWCAAHAGLDGVNDWESFCAQSGFDETGFAMRLEALDEFLDAAEEWVEKWSRFNGL